MTPLTVGTSGWDGTGPGTAELAAALVAGALPAGAIDTANLYGGGRAESIVGDALRGAAAPAVDVHTKIDRDAETGRFDAAQAWRSLEQSLDRLGVSRVPLLHLHDPHTIGFEATVAPGGPLSALVRMREEGIAGAIGLAMGPVGMAERLVETDAFDAVLTHNRWTLVDRSAGPLIAAAARRGMGIVNAAPYGAGALTGDERFRGRYGYGEGRTPVLAAVERIRAACLRHDVPLAAAALQFSLRTPGVHSTVVGMRSIARMDETVRLATAPIPDELWAELDGLAAPPEAWLDAPQG